MINNRQAGRRRGRGGQQQRPQGGNPGRLDTGNRIDNRARGNSAQLLEKYKTLARDAQMQGDRVNVEYYLQFADHYFRVLAETRARHEENGGAPMRRVQGATLDEDDTDFEDEGERIAPADQQRGDREGQAREGQAREGQAREGQGDRNGYRQDTRQNGYRSDGYRQDGRVDGNRGYAQNGQAPNGQAPNGQAPNGQASNGQPRNGQQNTSGESFGGGQDREERPRRTQDGGGHAEGGHDRKTGDRAGPDDRYAQSDREDVQAAPPQVEAEAPPRRGRGRPRRDGTVTPPREPAAETGFSADLLPPSLIVSAVVADDPGTRSEAVEKPKRGRGRPRRDAETAK